MVAVNVGVVGDVAAAAVVGGGDCYDDAGVETANDVVD